MSTIWSWASVMMLLCWKACCRLLASMPETPPLRLVVIATSMEGILTKINSWEEVKVAPTQGAGTSGPPRVLSKFGASTIDIHSAMAFVPSSFKCLVV